ncbi:MAG TPA: TIGR02281 family clan AA aspartic protease [Rhizobiales bacterium]|nr:TIGR02281 family clan AA aspartic protease [Hyphomicrobiales bacterium]
MAGRGFWLVLAAILAGLVFLIATQEPGFGGQGDRYARAIGLSILGTVIAVGILGSRRRLGGAARGLAAWAAILLALVACYQYRYELQDIASRITAGLVPGSPLSLAADGNTVYLEKAVNGHFEARITVDGVAVRALVDTGATATVLAAADARAVGADQSSLNYVIPVQTANGVARAARFTASEIAVGTIVRRNMTVLVAEAGALEQSLLGMSFLGSLSGIDVRGDRMILRD